MAELNKADVEFVAAAMWNTGARADGRPLWKNLKDGLDDALKKEFREQATVGIMAFLARQRAAARSAPEPNDV